MTEQTSTEDAVVIEREFEAPVEIIWRMWTVAEDFARWYGPNGASVPVAEIELRIGGRRLVCMEMETPQGQFTMCTVGEHLEIKPNEKLAYTEAHSDEKGNIQPPRPGQPGETRVVVTLKDLGRRTQMMLRHEGIPANSPGQVGWEQALDKMATQLT